MRKEFKVVDTKPLFRYILAYNESRNNWQISETFDLWYLVNGKKDSRVCPCWWILPKAFYLRTFEYKNFKETRNKMMLPFAGLIVKDVPSCDRTGVHENSAAIFLVLIKSTVFRKPKKIRFEKFED